MCDSDILAWFSAGPVGVDRSRGTFPIHSDVICQIIASSTFYSLVARRRANGLHLGSRLVANAIDPSAWSG